MLSFRLIQNSTTALCLFYFSFLICSIRFFFLGSSSSVSYISLACFSNSFYLSFFLICRSIFFCLSIYFLNISFSSAGIPKVCYLSTIWFPLILFKFSWGINGLPKLCLSLYFVISALDISILSTSEFRSIF